MKIVPDDCNVILASSSNDDLDKVIEITNAEWDEICNEYIRSLIDTHRPYDPNRIFKPFSQYLHELIQLKQDMKAK